VLPDPLRAPSAFAAALSELSRRLEPDVVLPVSEATLLAVLPRRDSVHGAIPFATAERFERICDKPLVLRAAAACGIATPAQRIAASAGEGAALADLLAYPVVLKPSRSVSTAPAGGVMAGAIHAADRGEFGRALLRIPASAFPVLVQARVVGPGTGVFVLLWRGEVLAAFAHRRLREKPPSGGVSVLRESVPLDPGLLARSVALLRALEWEGVAMVEYKVDAATGTPYLMEINGRLWGSLQLPIDAGVDFPVLLVDAALGRTPAPVTEYRVGVRSRWEWGDVDHLLTRLRHSRGSLALPPGAPGRLRVVADFVRGFGPNNRSEVLRRGDLRPFLRESADWLRRR
jgi:predicted ATP-grasp superfamily ATP-dependent carboligase